MTVKAIHAMKIVRLACLTGICVAVGACSGGYHTANLNGEKKVYRVDEQGAKTLVYETDQAGKTTIHDADDPLTKKQVAAQERAEQVSAERAGQREPLSLVPKRKPNDPIYVTLTPPVLDDNMQRAERSKGVVAKQIRREFVGDPVIKLTDEHRHRSGLLKPRMRVDAAVEVSPKVSLREAYGIDRKTGKRSKVLAVIFEATITSQTPPATYTVSESGLVLKNLEVSKRFAKQVKQVILEQIGPNLPAQ
ncbi:MAG: hypothetical protein OEV99_16305 [Nitrospira sp.]|nr:hypothetical protein [Nitrospira sp.]MDH4371385.1 hypothetical protein [Nitrospira sp.]MDH5347561.1 hypothetical protein [Nitrospira sp.]MDH5498972.1 hypothetical protein [Nitrospira sp.]MDH5725314.1 hypothetical protein [Nitrospira sp.]